MRERVERRREGKINRYQHGQWSQWRIQGKIRPPPPSCLTIDFGLLSDKDPPVSGVKTKSCAMYQLALMFHALGCNHCLLKVQIAANWLLPHSPFRILYLLTSVCVVLLRNDIIFFLQDLNETSDTNATGFPDLTKCFQITVLVWIPCGYLLTVAPFYIWSLVTSPRSYIRHTWLNVTKTVIDLSVWRCSLERLDIIIFNIIIYTLPFISYS